jgi:hypothetical protein
MVKSLTPDEVAMVVATSIVGETRCGIKGNNHPMNLAVAKLGQDLVDFKSDGRYAPLVKVKLQKGMEWVNTLGKEGCEGIRGALVQFLPDIYGSN